MRCNRLTFVILIVFLFLTFSFFSVQAAAFLVDSYSESNYDINRTIATLHPSTSIATSAIAQSFTMLSTNKILKAATFYLKRDAGYPGFLVARLYTYTGTYGTSSIPFLPLVTSTPVNASALYPGATLVNFTFPVGQQFQMVANYHYVISVEAYNGTFDSNNRVQVGYDASSPSHSGNMATFFSGVWSTMAWDSDVVFYVYGDTPPPAYADVTIQTSGSGTTIPATGQYLSTFLVGNTLNVTANPSFGWQYVKMQRNGIDWTTSNPGQFLSLAEVEVITVVFSEIPKSWMPVENWNLNIESIGIGWHNVETWNFSVRSFGLGFKNVETWNFNVASTGTGFHNVEAWLFNVSTGVPSWRNVEWWNVSLNTTTYGWHDVECWNLTANFTSTFQDVEWWSFGISTKSMGWHDAEVWNLTAQVFHRGLAWPAHVPFFLEDYNTYVDFDETAYFDSFALYSDRVEFFNVSMGIGMPIPDFTVATNNANMTFTTIDYLHSVGFDVWKSPVIWPWPVQWFGYFWGMDDPEELFIPSATWANTTWPEGSFWEMNVADHLLSAHWLLPPDFSVLFDWGAGPSQFREVETWTLYPYTGTSPDIPGVFSFPIMSIMGIIGLLCMFGGPLYGISKFKKKEYYSGAIVGLIFFVLGFALFIAWLWSG